MARPVKVREPRDPLPGDIEPQPYQGRPEDDSEVENVALWRDELGGETYQLIEWRYAVFAGCSLAGSTWVKSRFTDTTLEDCDLANSTYERCGFERVHFTHGRMTGFTVSGSGLTDIQVDHALADLSEWRFASVEHAVFRDCRLTRSDWTSAKLTSVRFEDCDLTGSEFSHSEMTGVSFVGCTLAEVRGVDGLRGSTVDRATLPDLMTSMAVALGIGLAED
jgi:uncharacterized protein YjbI with pentapeptide repeats